MDRIISRNPRSTTGTSAPLGRLRGRGPVRYRVRPPLTAVLALLVLSAFLASVARGACVANAPDSVLACLSAAYHDRDLDAYASLFTDDYVLVLDASTSWGLEEELAGARSLFSEPTIVSIDIRFGGPMEVKPGPLPGTWILDGVTADLTVVDSGQPEPIHTRHEGVRFFVRRVYDPAPGYRIYRWDMTALGANGN